MSGSSLDGLDIAYCEIQVDKGEYKWDLLACDVYPFSEMWQLRLKELPYQAAISFARTHTYFGHYMGGFVNDFIKKNEIEPDLIASHGHTIFHDPNKRMTSQIGDGGALAAITGLPVVNDFRTQDIAINGEGTPLAPIVDTLLFKEYDFCLNLGGIANITYTKGTKVIAFDVTACNQVLNALAQVLGLLYDENGNVARKGEYLPSIAAKINALPYFKTNYPKSISNEWVRGKILPVFLDDSENIENKITTACHLIGQHISEAIEQIIEQEGMAAKSLTMLVSGGGVLNTFLIECIQKYCKSVEIIIPNQEIINYKEAILMALLGVLRIENTANCLSSVTGATRDTIGGAIYQGYKKII